MSHPCVGALVDGQGCEQHQSIYEKLKYFIVIHIGYPLNFVIYQKFNFYYTIFSA